jgi:hypothetical protein
MQDVLYTALAAAAFAMVHVLSHRLTMLDRTPRSVWLSVAGGVSVAYVVIHLLPEIAHLQDRMDARGLLGIEASIYATALFGLVVFYGLEKLVRDTTKRREDRRSPPGVYWLHLGSFAVYNFLIAYLLKEQLREGGPTGLALYAFALGLHYVVNDRALYAHHGPRYMAQGRWILAGTVLFGWAVSQTAEIAPFLIEMMIAFLGGGVILNVVKEELPAERESRFSAFAAGAAGYAALLIVT